MQSRTANTTYGLKLSVIAAPEIAIKTRSRRNRSARVTTSAIAAQNVDRDRRQHRQNRKVFTLPEIIHRQNTEQHCRPDGKRATRNPAASRRNIAGFRHVSASDAAIKRKISPSVPHFRPDAGCAR